MNRRQWLKAGAALAPAWVASASGVLTGCELKRPGFNSGDITGAGWGGDFRVPDHHGVTRTLQDFRGKAVLLFFGFTQCPDVCPTALLRMQGVMRLLERDADRVQVLFMTVDPERDLPVVLKEYVTQFDKRFLGLAAGDCPDCAELQRLLPKSRGYYSNQLHHGPFHVHIRIRCQRPPAHTHPAQPGGGEARRGCAQVAECLILLAGVKPTLGKCPA